MNCIGYQNLLPQEKYEKLGKIIHLFQNHEPHFEAMCGLIEWGEKNGLFDGVEIMPARPNIKIEEESFQNG